MRGTWSICAFLLAAAACGDNNTPNGLPPLESFDLTTAEDTAVTQNVDVTDPDGSAVTLEATTPALGTVAIAGNAITYTP